MIINKFHCLGPVTGGNKSFHEEGFLKSSEKVDLDLGPNLLVNLFGKDYMFNTALTSHRNEIFDSCRKSFLFLHGNSSSRGLTTESSEDINQRLRNDISCFMNYLLHMTRYIEINTISDDFLRKFEVQLRRLRLIFHKLSLARVPDYTLDYYASTLGDSWSNPAQHLVHCHLDFRWIFINIIHNLEKFKDGFNCSQYSQANISLGGFVEEEILLLMLELVWLAVVRYEKTDKAELAHFPAFSCVCVKELWLLLLRFPYPSQDFWVYFNQTLKVILENKEPPVGEETNSLKIVPPDYLPCSNRNEFALWFLADIARLLEYDSNGEYVGANDSAGDKFEVVDDILRALFSNDVSHNEASMRSLIPLVSKILSSCSHIRSGPVLCLWEYFFKKINSVFYMPGSKLNSNIVLSKSGQALVQDAISRFDGTVRDKRENSFLMFLRLLGDHLMAGQQSGVSATRLCSRVFIKFSAGRPEKLKELTEPGIFHLTCLYITLAIGSATPTTINRLVEVLAAVPRTSNMKDAKHDMIFKGYAASLIALEYMNGDLSESADIITKHMDWCLSNPQSTPLVYFIDALKYLFEKDISRIRGLHHVLQSWIPIYISSCRKTEIVRVLSIFIPLLQKLKSFGSYISDGQNMRTKVEKFIMPCLVKYESTTTAELAALCLLCLPNYKMELFRYWTEREDCAISGKFLSTVISHGGANINSQLPQIGNLVQLVWARCCFIWGNNDDTKSLSHFLSELPSAATIKIDWTGPQPFKDFADFFGVEYSMCQNLMDKSSLRTLFQLFFQKFDKWIDSKCKSLEEFDVELADRFYDYSSYLFIRCPHLIYTKSNPHCILKIIIDYLILPRQIYKVEYKPPQKTFAAITHNLHHFINGLLALDAARDPYIGRLLRDIITCYLTKLRNVPIEINPLVATLKENNNSFLLSIFKGFFKVQSGSVDQNAVHALHILHECIKSDVPITNIIFQETIEAVTELIILLDDLHPTKDIALSYVKTATYSACNRKRILITLSDACKKYLAFNAAAWFNAVKRFAPLCRDDLAPLLSIATQVVEDIEKRRGVQLDASLRRMLQTLELAIG